MSKRCSCFASTTGLKCRLKTKNKYNNQYVCHVHAAILFTDTAIFIQKMYIGYRTRRKFKNIFVKLPTDLQKMILWYMRRPLYIKRYHNAISNILDKKISNITMYEQNYDYYRRIGAIYTLYTKYISITAGYATIRLYKLQPHFLNLFKRFVQTHASSDDLQTYDIVKNILVESFKTFKITYDTTFDVPLRERTHLYFYI